MATTTLQSPDQVEAETLSAEDVDETQSIVSESLNSEHATIQRHELGIPPTGPYASLQALSDASQAFARAHGYELVLTNPRKNVAKQVHKYRYRCKRGGMRNNTRKLKDVDRKRSRSSIKTGCQMRVVAAAVDPRLPEGPWEVRPSVNWHNHPADDAIDLPGHGQRDRHGALTQKMLALSAVGIKPLQIAEFLQQAYPEHLVTRKDIRNTLDRAKRAASERAVTAPQSPTSVAPSVLPSAASSNLPSVPSSDIIAKPLIPTRYSGLIQGRVSKNTPPRPPTKTDRRELHPIQRAQVVALWAYGNKSQRDIAELLLGDKKRQSTIAKIIRRAQESAKELGCSLTDPRIYDTKPGRGRKSLEELERQEQDEAPSPESASLGHEQFEDHGNEQLEEDDRLDSHGHLGSIRQLSDYRSHYDHRSQQDNRSIQEYRMSHGQTLIQEHSQSRDRHSVQNLGPLLDYQHTQDSGTLAAGSTTQSPAASYHAPRQMAFAYQ